MADYLDHALRDAGRIELRHQDGDRWVSGLFDDIGALRLAIHRQAARGNLYTSINAPKLMPVSNAMHDRALVDDDIVMRTRLVFDFDPIRPKNTPSTDTEMRAAGTARDRLVSAFSAAGWPQPATALSGNGAHALYRVRMKVSSESTAMLKALYVGLKADFDTNEVDFDTTVRNPSRIWRLYGCVNRKGIPTLARPHRIAQASIPGRWQAVSPQQIERMASMYVRRPQPPAPRPAQSIDGDGDYTTLDIAGWFEAHGHYRRPLDGGMHAVRCPWNSDHSNVDTEQSTATVVWEPTGRCWPNFRCLHAHCDGRGIKDVLQAWGDADAFCARAWRAAP